MKQQHFRNEKEYYEFLDYINKECEAGKISTDEKDLMVQMATNEESTRRRTERNALNVLINNESINEGEEGYYTLMVYNALNEKYYNCEYNLYDLKKAKRFGFDPCLTSLVENNSQKELDSVCKLIFEDIKNNALDLRNVPGEELYKKYIERVWLYDARNFKYKQV